MTHEELFLVTVEELEQHLALAKRQLDALGLALPLRKLIAEGSIVGRVSKPRRVKVIYQVNDLSPPLQVDWYPNEMIYPDPAWGAWSPVVLDRQGLLHRIIMVAFGEQISVSDLIKFMANYEGVVHQARPVTPKMKALWDYNWGSRVTTPQGQFTGAAYALLPIAQLVLDGLSTLRDQIERETRTPGFSESFKGLSRVRDPSSRGG